MTYGVFNLASGNLIDSVESERDALELLSSLLDERGANAEEIGLVVANDAGHTLASLHGQSLADAVYAGGIRAAVSA